MEEPLQMVEAVRQACMAAALQAYEEAGLSGLCQEGRWEYAMDAMRRLNLRPVGSGAACGLACTPVCSSQ
jgi:hypothetical protein